MVIGIKAGKIDEYKALHAAVWPTVLAKLSAANVRNYTIFLREPENLLFGYWEYHGADYEADMRSIAADWGYRDANERIEDWRADAIAATAHDLLAPGMLRAS